MDKFKKPKISTRYVANVNQNLRDWLIDCLGLPGAFLFMIITIQSKNAQEWIMGTTIEVILLSIANHISHKPEVMYDSNRVVFSYEKVLDYLLGGIELTFLGFCIVKIIHWTMETMLSAVDLTVSEDLIAFIFLSVLMLFFVMLPLSIIISVVLIYADDMFLECIRKILRWKLKSKFPVSESQLRKCGVKDKKDCMLYYCWIMHRYGKEKHPVIKPRELPGKTINEMKNIYMTFPDAEKPTDPMYRKFQNWDNFKTNEEKNDAVYWHEYYQYTAFADQLDGVNYFYYGGKYEND